MASRRPLGRGARSLRRLFLAGFVIAVVVAYVGPVQGYLSQRSELHGYVSALRAAEAQRDRIARQIDALRQPAVLEARARELNMVKPGEQSYLVEGLGRPAPRAAARSEGSGGFWSRLFGLL